MRILSVAPYVPYERVPHAGGLYLLRHLQALSREHEVTLLAPESDEWNAHRDRVPEWLDLVVAPLQQDRRTFRRRLLDAAYRRSMASPPGPSPESLRAIRREGLVARAAQADLVELHWPEYARLAGELRAAGVRTPVCIVEHDVDLEAAARRLRQHAVGYRRWSGLLTAPLLRRWERNGLLTADLVLVFKREDEQLLRRLGVSTEVMVIDPWLDPPLPAEPATPPQVLFAGAMWRRENSDGAAWLLREVWPTVLQQVPDAELVVAGAGPSDEVTALAAAAHGVQVTGEVPDLLPYYARASMFVAPMFVGGGLKFKVAQAMLCGLPAVVTENAGEGIVGRAPAAALWAVTDDPQRTAEALVAGLREPDAARRTGEAAAAWAKEQWSFARSLDQLSRRYLELARRTTT
jgi:glycosyltransferase involved in cell wall biosynthesis